MQRFLLVFIGSVLVLFFARCTDHKTKEGSTRTYSIYLMDDNGDESIVEVNSLAENKQLPSDSGVIKLHTKEFQRDLMVRNGFYYNKKKDFFFKYSTAHQQMEKLDSIPMKDFLLYNYHWIAEDTLLLLGTSADYKQTKFAKINTKDMEAQEGLLDIPSFFGTYNVIAVGVSHLKNGKLFVGYNYCSAQENSHLNGDTTYVAVFSYPAMKRLQVMKDTRSVFPGGENTVEPASFEDEKGDFYFLACPGIALGGRMDKPTGIYRISSTDEQLDSSYFFNISASPIQNHAYSMYYLGQGKALIRSERKDLYTSWAEHWKVAHYEFYVIDLAAQSTTKLELPLDKGTRRQCVLVEDGKAYISLNSDTAGNYIWIYDIAKGTLAKGLQFKGDTDFIMRIDRLSSN